MKTSYNLSFWSLLSSSLSVSNRRQLLQAFRCHRWRRLVIHQERLSSHMQNFIISFISPKLLSVSHEVQHSFSTFGVARNEIVFSKPFRVFAYSRKPCFSILETRYSRLETRYSRLDPRTFRASRLEDRGSSFECQLTFERYCINPCM